MSGIMGFIAQKRILGSEDYSLKNQDLITLAFVLMPGLIEAKAIERLDVLSSAIKAMAAQQHRLARKS